VVTIALLAGGCTLGGRMSQSGDNAKSRLRSGEKSRWAVDVDLDTTGYDPVHGSISCSGAIGETVMVKVGFRALDTLTAFDVGLTTLRSVNSALELPPAERFRLAPVRLGPPPGWHVRMVLPSDRRTDAFDVAVPADAPNGGLPTSVDDGQMLWVLFELHVPRGTVPGKYDANIQVRYRGGAPPLIPFEVTVWPFELPTVESPRILTNLNLRSLISAHIHDGEQPYQPTSLVRAFTDPQWSERLTRLLGDTVQLLQDHGVTPVFSSELQPASKLDRNRRWHIDWTDFDQVVNRYLTSSPIAGGVSPCCFEMPLDLHGDGLLQKSTIERTEAEHSAFRFLSQWSDHFFQRGWLDAIHVICPMTSPTNPQYLEDLQRVADVVSRVRPHLTSVLALTNGDSRHRLLDVGKTADLPAGLDIQQSLARFCTAEKIGKRTWMRVDCPPYGGTLSVHGLPADARVIPWQAWRYRMEAVRVSAATRWPGATDDETPTECLAFDDSVLLFPGGTFGLDHPVASMRLKYLRRGMTDLAYFKLLKSRGLEHVVEAVVQALSPYALAEAAR